MMENSAWQTLQKTLTYDKGGHRKKHEGNRVTAEIKTSGNGEIGLCPKDFPLETAQQLLQNAIPEFRKTSSDRPKALWNSYEGVVYRALRSSADATSWHAFPVKSNIPRTICRQLLEKIQDSSEQKALKKWMECS